MKIEKFQERLLGEGLSAGYSDMEIYYEKTKSFACEIYEGELDEYEAAENAGLSFRGVYDGKMGYAYTEKFDVDSIDFLLKKAKENAQIIEQEEQDEIYEGDEGYAELSFYSESLTLLTPEEKIQFMQEIEKKLLSYDPRIASLNYCKLVEEEKERMIANSKGLVLHDEKNYLAVILSVIVKEGSETKSGFTVKVTKDLKEWDMDKIVQEAAEEALAYLGEQSIPSKRYPIILRHDAAASFLATFSSVFSAEVAQKGRSLLADKEGSDVAAEMVTITDNPFLENGLSNRIFDGEGVSSKVCKVIEAGKLQTLLHNRRTAKKAGVETTGHAYKSSYKGTLSVAPSNFYIEAGERAFEEMIAGLDEAVLITKLSGLHAGANSVSGDFSLAANGFFIKNGQIQSAIKQMTIAGNFFSVLNNIQAIANDLYVSTNGIGSPSILIKGLPVTVE